MLFSELQELINYTSLSWLKIFLFIKYSLLTPMFALSATTESSPQELLIRTFVPESIQDLGGKRYRRSLVTQMIRYRRNGLQRYDRDFVFSRL